ncbi:MAG: hypothetical protein WCJ58_07300 [bacterium]
MKNHLKISRFYQIFVVLGIIVIISLTGLILWRFSSLRKLPQTGGDDISFKLPTGKLNKLSLRKSYTKSTDITPFTKNTKISALGLDGVVTLNKDTSYVRIVLVDNNSKEYLAYEAYPLINKIGKSNFVSACQETCFLTNITPVSIKIQIKDASIELTNLNLKTDLIKTNTAIVKDLKKQQDQKLIAQINNNIKQLNQAWIASETSLSKLSYEEQRKAFGSDNELPLVGGLVFYKGGIMDLRENKTAVPNANTNFRKAFDWRNVNGTDWITSVKSQGTASTCYAHADTAMFEAQINRYYNQKLDLDLSEQLIVDCQWPSTNPITWQKNPPDISAECPGGFGSDILSRISYWGLPDEKCDPYVNRDEKTNQCTTAASICPDWASRVWKASNWYQTYTKYSWPWGYEDGYANENPSCQNLKNARYVSDVDEFKKELITKGPLHVWIASWKHELMLTGYNTINDWSMIDSCEDIIGWDKLSCDSKGSCLGSTPFCTSTNLGSSTCFNDKVAICKYEDDTYSWGSTGRSCPGILCSPNQVGQRSCINNAMYKCVNNAPDTYWEKDYDCKGSCVNSLCKTDTAFQRGDLRCTRNANDNHYFLEMYTPGLQNQTVWIMKNSSAGGDWGDNGYISVVVDYENLVMGSYLTGTITPPTDQSFWPKNFNNKIKCVDNDKDGYCSWGSSATMPASCKDLPYSCKPTQDCDDSNSAISLLDNNYNCVNPTAKKEICGNGIDDDVNGFADCNDQACASDPTSQCCPVGDLAKMGCPTFQQASCQVCGAFCYEAGHVCGK